MSLNQNQITDLVFADVTAAEAAGRPGEICYVQSLKTFYDYVVAGSAYTVDHTAVLSTGNAGNTRWAARAGRYMPLPISYGVEWDESADTYVRTGALAGVACGSSPGNALLPAHASMRRCLLQDDGVVEYYLDPTDGTKKVGGAAADITSGDDGQVMLQIAAYYRPYAYTGTTHAWGLSQTPREGYSLDPAFIKNDEFVPYRYIGAYEGSMWDASAGAMTPDADIEVDMYAAGDKLCSLSGQYPKTNETRAEFRAMAASRGTGWRQVDYDLMSAIQLLYLTEYADFYSQSMISNGRTMFNTGAWEAANQGVGKYIGKCGYSNGDGNASGGHSRSSAVSIAAINTETDASYHDYMSYRGIENLFGNIWKWVDGVNVGGAASPADDYNVHVCNNDTQFADDTWTDYTEIEGILPALASGTYQATLLQQPRGFLPATIGATSTTKITDALWTAAGWRVVQVGGSAHDAANAGAFCVYAKYASSDDTVSIGGRLAY